MTPDLPETDWKTLSRLKPLALDRLCERILLESEDIIVRAKEGGNHSAYLDLYRHIQESDERVGKCFNDWKRSQAMIILMNWRTENLLSEEEFAAFSAETRDKVERFLKRE